MGTNSKKNHNFFAFSPFFPFPAALVGTVVPTVPDLNTPLLETEGVRRAYYLTVINLLSRQLLFYFLFPVFPLSNPHSIGYTSARIFQLIISKN